MFPRLSRSKLSSSDVPNCVQKRRFNLHSFSDCSANTNSGTHGAARFIGSPRHIIFVFPSFTDQGYRWLLSAIRCCVADVTAFIVTMIYWFRMTTATGKNSSKSLADGRRGANLCQLLSNFHPIPQRTAHFASGYCLAICFISSLYERIPPKQTRRLCQALSLSFCPVNSALLCRITYIKH